MWGLSDSASFWVPLTVLGASLVGSGHCAAMCGGLVSAFARTRVAWMGYQMGRLAGYLALGGIFGLLGDRFLKSADTGFPLLSWIATALLAAAFTLYGIQIFRGKSPHFPTLPSAMLQRLYRLSGGNAVLSGLLSAFLPCGWLHVYVLGAAATRSPARGALFLFVFWLGTLPALAATPWLFNRVFRPFSRQFPRFAGILLILIAALSLTGKMVSGVSTDTATGSTEQECHR